MSPRQGEGRAVRLYYETTGEDGPWVTLIHGGLVDSTSWASVAGPLARSCRTLAYDARGFGRSDRASAYSVEASVEDLLGLWDDLSIESSIVVGFSQGGVVAQATAVAAPARVKGLVLVGTYARRSPQETERAEERARDAERDGIETQVGVHLQRVFSEAYLAEHAEEAEDYIERLRGNDPHAFASTMRAMSHVDLSQALPGLTVPVVVVVGSEDRAVGVEHSEYLARSIPDAELVVVPECGHTVSMERPDALLDVIHRLLGRLDKGATDAGRTDGARPC